MLKQTLLSGLIALAGSTALAATSLPSSPKRTPYADARKALIAQGWQPAPISSDPNRCAPGADECETYPEAVSCSGTGLMMTWLSAGTCR